MREPIPRRTPPSRGSLVAAASSGVAPLVGGARREARILGAFRSAVYLEVAEAPPPAVVSLLTSDAVRLPNGVVIAESSSAGPLTELAHATSAFVGEATVTLRHPAGPVPIRVTRWWRPPVPRPARSRRALAEGVAGLRAALDGVTGGLAGHEHGTEERPWSDPPPDLSTPESAERLCARLVGRGPGLTPSGDDVLCGAILSLTHLAGPGAARELAAAATRRATTSTTALSGALLRHATRREGCPEVIALLEAVCGHRPVLPALAALRGIGHTSGTDLALGVLTGATAAIGLPPEPERARQERTRV